MDTFERFIERPLKGRIRKPRANGLTMIMDNGMGVTRLKDFLNIGSEWIDIAKLGYGTSRLCPEEIIREKIEAYRAHNIYVMAIWPSRRISASTPSRCPTAPSP